MSSTGSFFAIDRYQWEGICEMGLNCALFYLVVARGSDKSNRFSSWSALSLEKYTGVSRRRAQAARDAVASSKFLSVLKSGKHPRYEITRSVGFDSEKDYIWLPNELVDGVRDTPSPITRIRETADVRVLQLFVTLYSEHNIAEDAGITRYLFQQKYERTKICEHREYCVWGFNSENLECRPGHETIGCIFSDDHEEFFTAIHLLISLGLVIMTPCAFESDSPDSEVIVSIGPDGLDSDALLDDLLKLLPEEFTYPLEDNQIALPFFQHLRQVQVMGVGVLRYRPKTSLTAAGYATSLGRKEAYLQQLSKLWSPELVC